MTLNWDVLSDDDKDKLQSWALHMCSAIAVSSVATSHVDLYGHVGGMIAGYCLTVITAGESSFLFETRDNKVIRVVFISAYSKSLISFCSAENIASFMSFLCLQR